VISGHCECCEAFEFEVETNSDGSAGEHLNDIIFHYSDPDKSYLIAAAKRIAEGAGLPKDQAALIGRKPVERFYWDDERAPVRQSYTLEVHLTMVEKNWEFDFYILAEPL